MDASNIIDRLARLEEKLDAFLVRTNATESRLMDHDARLRAMETSSAKMLGVGTGLALVVSLVAQYLPIG